VSHFGAGARRSCGLVDLRSMRPGSSAGGRWPGATLRPSEAREVPPKGRSPSKEVVPAQCVPIKRHARAVMEGGNSYPSCIGQALEFRDTRRGNPAASTRVRPASGGNAVFGMNGQEGADPSDGERLPTRRKPSEGGALVGMRTSSESSSVDNDGLPRNPANPMSGTELQ
jgi:hypothetical protein